MDTAAAHPSGLMSCPRLIALGLSITGAFGEDNNFTTMMPFFYLYFKSLFTSRVWEKQDGPMARDSPHTLPYR